MEFNNSLVNAPYETPKDTPRGVEISRILRQSLLWDKKKGNDGVRHLPLSYIEWKDDCESSKSNKASKSGSMWIFTITILLGSKDYDSPCATFPLVIGPKSSCHNEVERIIGNDMQRLTKYKMPAFICDKDNHCFSEVTFSAAMYLSLGDQPERRSGNYLLNGNSTSHGRWRYACNHSKLPRVLPACKDCFELMKMADMGTYRDLPDWMSHHCTECTNWMIGSLTDEKLSYKPSQDYPIGYLLGGTPSERNDGMVNPIVLSYSILKGIVSTTHEKVVTGAWNSKTAKAFLRENGISEKYSKSIVYRAVNCNGFQLKYENREKEPEEWE